MAFRKCQWNWPNTPFTHRYRHQEPLLLTKTDQDRDMEIHHDDVIMSAIASQVASLTIVYSTVYPGADQCKHQSSASLAFVWGIHRGPMNSPHKWPVTLKMFRFDDVIMHRHYFKWDAITHPCHNFHGGLIKYRCAWWSHISLLVFYNCRYSHTRCKGRVSPILSTLLPKMRPENLELSTSVAGQICSPMSHIQLQKLMQQGSLILGIATDHARNIKLKANHYMIVICCEKHFRITNRNSRDEYLYHIDYILPIRSSTNRTCHPGGLYCDYSSGSSLQWRQNERDGVSNHRCIDCLLNRLFRRRLKETSKLRINNLAWKRNSPVTGEFSAQRASNAENVSIWRRRHGIPLLLLMPQLHPTTDPVRFLAPLRFPARKTEWNTDRNFSPDLFSLSQQIMGPVRLILLFLKTNRFDQYASRLLHFHWAIIHFPQCQLTGLEENIKWIHI